MKIRSVIRIGIYLLLLFFIPFFVNHSFAQSLSPSLSLQTFPLTHALATDASLVTVTNDTYVSPKNMTQHMSSLPGEITVSPDSFSVTVALGYSLTLPLTLTNNGDTAVTFIMAELERNITPTWSLQEQFDAPTSYNTPGQDDVTSMATRAQSPLPLTPALAAGDIITSWSSGLFDYGIAAGRNGDIWVSSPGSGWGGNATFNQFDMLGNATGISHSYSWGPTTGPADATYNPLTRTYWLLGVGGGNCLYEMDPTLGYTGATICPGFAISQRGLTYDPVNDIYFAGGWNESRIYLISSGGTILNFVNVGIQISGLAYNPATKHLFVMTNYSPGPSPVYVLDTADNFNSLGQFTVQGFDANAGVGLDIDCEGYLWMPHLQNGNIYKIDSGETAVDICYGELPWLHENPITSTVAVSGSTVVDITFDATAITQTGQYVGTLFVTDDTPDLPIPIAVTMTVVVNTPPVAADDLYTATEDVVLNIPATGILANDSDADGDTLTAVLDTDVTSGILALNNDGSFSYIPDADFCGQDSFTYHAHDGWTSTNMATVVLNVDCANDAPVAASDAYSATEDVLLNIAASGVLGNDNDVDGDVLTAVLDSDVTSGTLTLNSNGSFSYTSDLNYCGADSFTYHASDGQANSNMVTVTLFVSCINDVPVANDDIYTTTEDIVLNIAAAGVLTNDADVDGDGLTAVLDSNVSNGTLTLNGDGSFDYTPNSNYCGSDTFTYHAHDGLVDSNITSVTLQVICVNDAPQVIAGSDQTVDEGATVLFNGSFIDPGLHTSDFRQGLDETIHWDFGDGGTATGTLTPTHLYEDNGTFSVTLTITDSDGLPASDILIVTANNVAPIIQVGDDMTAVTDEVLMFTGTYTDPGTVDTHTISWDFGDGHTAVGSLSVTHAYTASGTYTATLTVIDDDGGSGNASLIITVEPASYPLFLPAVMNNAVHAPDLIVTDLTVTANNVQVVIMNQGNAPVTNDYWVDVYINPDTAPTGVNQTWVTQGGEGLVWGVVNDPLAVGESRTLTLSSSSYDASRSNFSGSIAAGSVIYAQVDSARLATSYGNVLENHELLGQPYNNILMVTTAVSFSQNPY